MELWSTWSGLEAAGRDLLTGVLDSLVFSHSIVQSEIFKWFFSHHPPAAFLFPWARVKEELGCDVQVQGLDEELFGTEATLV